MISDQGFLPVNRLQDLIDALYNAGYLCIGPQVQDHAIVYRQLKHIEQLPKGFHDQQSPGSYLLSEHQSEKYFDWANGPEAIKPRLFCAEEKLWQSSQQDNGQIHFKASIPETQPIAIIGARSCDIAAMKIQDQHFLEQQMPDPYYKARRENLFTLVVNCNRPAATCFCHSTGDGPFCDNASDLTATELAEGFILQAASLAGRDILSQLSLSSIESMHENEAHELKQQASVQQRSLPKFDIPSRLFNELDNDAWHDIAQQCLSCGNCTAVCPTCFCHSEQDRAALDGKSSEHIRQWDSCFNQGHSYIHGITIRSETSQRYRQWLTHKFASWHEQYGRSGCVGCGRCISWCPVGIDVTESIAKIGERRHG